MRQTVGHRMRCILNAYIHFSQAATGSYSGVPYSEVTTVGSEQSVFHHRRELALRRSEMVAELTGGPRKVPLVPHADGVLLSAGNLNKKEPCRCFKAFAYHRVLIMRAPVEVRNDARVSDQRIGSA